MHMHCPRHLPSAPAPSLAPALPEDRPLSLMLTDMNTHYVGYEGTTNYTQECVSRIVAKPALQAFTCLGHDFKVFHCFDWTSSLKNYAQADVITNAAREVLEAKFAEARVWFWDLKSKLAKLVYHLQMTSNEAMRWERAKVCVLP